MKVFVTGGGGLVGSHAIERLAAHGHAVRALVRDNVGRSAVQALGAEPVFGLVEQPAGWEGARGVDVIVHTAALIQQRAPWSEFEGVNVVGTRLAAEAARRHGTRLVHISSVAVYDRARAPAGPITEDAPLKAPDDLDHYARSKVLAEEAVRAAGVAAVILRPCVVYGERDRLFMPRVLGAVRVGFAPLIGGGGNALGMVYAGNVADAIRTAVERSEVRGAFTVANDGRITQREFFDTIARTSGRRLRYVRLPGGAASAVGWVWEHARRAINPSRYPGFSSAAIKFLAAENPYASERAVRDLGWRPGTAPLAALERSVRWQLESD